MIMLVVGSIDDHRRFHIFLLSNSHFSMSQHLVVEHVSGLHAVEHLALFVVAHARHHGHCLVVICVEISVFGVDFLPLKKFAFQLEFPANQIPVQRY